MFYRYVPRKPRLVVKNESARNEISILFAGMPRAVHKEHHFFDAAIKFHPATFNVGLQAKPFLGTSVTVKVSFCLIAVRR